METDLPDPTSLLEGSGKFKRHVKLRSENDVDAAARAKLIDAAYAGMRARLDAE